MTHTTPPHPLPSADSAPHNLARALRSYTPALHLFFPAADPGCPTCALPHTRPFFLAKILNPTPAKIAAPATPHPQRPDR